MTAKARQLYERAAMARDIAVAAACAVCVWVLFVRKVHPVDFMVFLHGARAVSHGVSPYVGPSSPALWSGHAFVYPYFTAWLFVPFNGLSISAAGLIYYALSVVAVLLAVRLVTGQTAGIVPLVLALTAEPVVRGFQLGTLNVWLLLGLAVAWRYRDRVVAVTLALTAVIVAKLFLLPMIAWLLVTRRIKPAVATVALSAAVIVVGCEVAGLSVSTFQRMLSNLSAHEGPHSSSITAALSHLDASGLALTIGPMLLAAAIVAFGWARYRSSGDEAIVFCACVVASVVASPIVWSHYFTLLVIIPLVLGWRWQYQLLTLAATWLMGKPDGVGALSVLHPFPGSGWLWAGLAAVGAVIWHRHRRRPSAGHAGAVDDATLPANAGLCGQCVHALLRPTNRGTVYLRCGLAATDPRFPKYPRLPMLECAGFTVMSTGEAAAP